MKDIYNKCLLDHMLFWSISPLAPDITSIMLFTNLGHVTCYTILYYAVLYYTIPLHYNEISLKEHFFFHKTPKTNNNNV